MSNNNTREILRLYFGKNFSHSGRVLFGRWLNSNSKNLEKEGIFEELWEQIPAEIQDSTFADWQKIAYSIKPMVSKKKSLYSIWLKYAAIVIFVLSTSFLTYWWASQEIHAPEMVEVFVPYGNSQEIYLPDGTVAYIGAGSLLIYPKDFSKMNTRTIYLTGEASFTVKKDLKQPFIVKTTYIDVQALGTVFTVESYPNDVYTKTTLEEGSVKVDVRGGNISSSILKPDQQLIYSHIDHSVKIDTIDSSLFRMERSGYLIYENISFVRLITSIERAFNVTVHYNSNRYSNELYNVKFSPDETLEDVLNVLQQLMGIRYKVKGNVVFIN